MLDVTSTGCVAFCCLSCTAPCCDLSLYVGQLVCWLKICQFSCTFVALYELKTGREIHRDRAPLSILRALTMLPFTQKVYKHSITQLQKISLLSE